MTSALSLNERLAHCYSGAVHDLRHALMDGTDPVAAYDRYGQF